MIDAILQQRTLAPVALRLESAPRLSCPPCQVICVLEWPFLKTIVISLFSSTGYNIMSNCLRSSYMYMYIIHMQQ